MDGCSTTDKRYKAAVSAWWHDADRWYSGSQSNSRGHDQHAYTFWLHGEWSFEGCERESLKTVVEKDLYSAQTISDEEIKKLQNYIGKEIPGCPSSLVFSKSFISFSKDKNQAEFFFSKYNKNAMLTVVEYDNTFNLNTHAYIKDISIIPDEEEVLFFLFLLLELIK